MSCVRARGLPTDDSPLAYAALWQRPTAKGWSRRVIMSPDNRRVTLTDLLTERDCESDYPPRDTHRAAPHTVPSVYVLPHTVGGQEALPRQ